MGSCANVQFLIDSICLNSNANLRRDARSLGIVHGDARRHQALPTLKNDAHESTEDQGDGGVQEDTQLIASRTGERFNQLAFLTFF